MGGRLGIFLAAVAIVMSLFHMYAAYAIVPTQTLRPIHVAFELFLSFLMFPVSKRFRHRILRWDWAVALLAIAVAVYLHVGGDDFTDRNTRPNPWDIVFGVALILMVLESRRRRTGRYRARKT